MAVVTGVVVLWVVLFVAAGLYVRYRLKESMADVTRFAPLELPKAEEGHELKEVAAGRTRRVADPSAGKGEASALEIVKSMPAPKPLGLDGSLALSEAEEWELAALVAAAAEEADTDSVVGGASLTPVEVVEVMPHFPGGLGALMKWLDANVDYPEACIRRHVKGRVEVSFTVDTDGSVRDAAVTREVDPLLDKACLTAVRKMPRWIPGRDEGRLVSVRVTLPVEFDPD